MFLMSLSFVLIVAIALWQIRLGAFSALIALILAALSAAIAFNYFESLANAMFTWTDQKRHPMYMNAAALMLLFVVVQLVLRFVFDLLISNDVGFAMWPNRIVAGALGLLVGMVQVGMLMIALQMLPISQSVFTYVAYKDDLKPGTGLAPFYPDRFVLKMVDAFSKGGLAISKSDPTSADDRSWGAVHDDFLKEQFARRNRGWERIPDSNNDYRAKPGTVFAPPGTLSAAALFQPPTEVQNDLPASADLRSSGEYYVARATISSEAREPADADDKVWYRLAGTHFEMIAAVKDNTGRVERKRFYPVAFLVKEKNGRWSLVKNDERSDSEGSALPARLIVERDWKVKPFDEGLTIDWVYHLPTGATPQSLTFRGGTPKPFPDFKENAPGRLEGNSLERKN